jgi:hypothetical protein
MKLSSVYTKQWLGLDRMVWVTLATVALLSLGLVGYRLIGDEPCTNVVITVTGITEGKNKTYYVGETVSFAAPMAAGKSIKWDFGDKTNVEQGIRVTHNFMKEGDYTVTATVNGRCMQYERISIRKLVDANKLDSNSNLSNIFSNPIVGNTSPQVMQSVVFSSAIGARSYEWSILNMNNYPTIVEAQAQYTFLSPGPKVLQLMLDGDPKKVFKKDINVQPLPNLPSSAGAPPASIVVLPPLVRPQAGAPTATDPAVNNAVQALPEAPKPESAKTEPAKIERPKTQRISDDYFKDLLQDVVNNSLELADFDEYLCDKGKTRVLINDDKNWSNFQNLVQQIRGEKRVTIESVEQTIENGCVVKLKVKYDKKKKFPFIK